MYQIQGIAETVPVALKHLEYDWTAQFIRVVTDFLVRKPVYRVDIRIYLCSRDPIECIGEKSRAKIRIAARRHAIEAQADNPPQLYSPTGFLERLPVGCFGEGFAILKMSCRLVEYHLTGGFVALLDH